MNLRNIFTISIMICLFFSSFLFTSCNKEESNLIVQTDKGRIEGTYEGGVKVFKGVPYAAPPIDKLRFAPPQEKQKWNEILECKKFKPSAMQFDSTSDKKEKITLNEDCLYLNVWAPEDAKSGDKLPVLVYIHGGSFSSGSPERPTFNGTRFAKDGVIQVDIEYRVNALGFSAFEEIENKYGYLGNAGLLDQIASLKWVQHNIEEFGGDKNNVTISGESAGSISVSDLVISPEAKGLFHRAIMESGNLLGQKIIAPLSGGDRQSAIQNTQELMKKVGAKSIDDMYEIHVNKLVDDSIFSVKIHDQTDLYFLPVFDGKVIPENPLDAIEKGNVNCDTILTGYNTNEGSMFVPKGTDEAIYRKLLEKIFDDKADIVYQRFPVDQDHTAYERAEYLITMGLTYGSQIYADKMSELHKTAYFYNFDYISPTNRKLDLGSTHTAELGYVFDTVTKSERNSESRQMTDQIHSRWINFVKSGDPNKGINQDISWSMYQNNEEATMRLDLRPELIKSPMLQDARFMEKILFGDTEFYNQTN